MVVIIGSVPGYGTPLMASPFMEPVKTHEPNQWLEPIHAIVYTTLTIHGIAKVSFSHITWAINHLFCVHQLPVLKDAPMKKPPAMNKNTSSDFKKITETQKKTWSAGDFNQIARQNWMMGEALCAAADLRPGQRVLDVACGSGTAALVAERRYCEVTGLDYVPELIDRARLRAEANGQEARFIVGDAQDLPFPDNSFDVILSVYGVQFAPDQQKAADEMLRVCKPGGTIALAGPVPRGWSGDFFAAHARYNPPPPGIPSPLDWGTEDGIRKLLGAGCSSIDCSNRVSIQYYHSADHAVEVFSRWFGPTIIASEKLPGPEYDSLLEDLKNVFEKYNQADDGTAAVENIYLQVLAEVK